MSRKAWWELLCARQALPQFQQPGYLSGLAPRNLRTGKRKLPQLPASSTLGWLIRREVLSQRNMAVAKKGPQPTERGGSPTMRDGAIPRPLSRSGNRHATPIPHIRLKSHLAGFSIVYTGSAIGVRSKERFNRTRMTRMRRIIADKTEKDLRQFALSASSAFYESVHRCDNHSS